MQKTLSKQFGLYSTPSPLLELNFDAFRYCTSTIMHKHICEEHACTGDMYMNVLHRSTAVEVLHTLLLGPYKYLLGKTMQSLSPSQKREMLALVTAFNYSVFSGCLTNNAPASAIPLGEGITRCGLRWPHSF